MFSSAWVAAAAGALALSAASALGAEPGSAAALRVAALACAGTLVVYNVDRLRDLDRDRSTTPLRSAFVAAHRRGLMALAGCAAVAAVVLGARVGPSAVVLCAAVLVPGLLHRRWKRVPGFKLAYVTGAWLAVVVGLPALALPGAHGAPAVAGVLGPALLANAIASNVRDAENLGGPRWERRALGVALAVAGGGAAVALAAAATRPLAAVPVAVFASIAAFRPGERYGLWVVDGALLAGSLVSLAL